jgi:hypothetical protein
VEETAILKAAPELVDYVAGLKRSAGGRGTLVLRRLLQLVREYPRQRLLTAVHTASHYGLYDLERLEEMVLRRIAKDYFIVSEE